MKKMMKLPPTWSIANYRKYKSYLDDQVKTVDKENNRSETLFITRVYCSKEDELKIENEVNEIMESK